MPPSFIHDFMRLLHGAGRWMDRNVLELGREMRVSFLPPLMIYLAAGVSGLTGIVGTFFVKDYLGLSASFLASLGFWAGIPWTLKMPVGHIVDLFWRWKSWLVVFGASLIATSLLIMVGLLTHTRGMVQICPAEAWFILSALLAPVGYVVQDVVADAMTVEAVPRTDEDGHPVPADKERLMHTTMQTLGRVAIIGGGVAVAVANIFMFRDVESMSETAKLTAYTQIYLYALVIPVISVAGIILASFLKARRVRALKKKGFNSVQINGMLSVQAEQPQPNWWIIIGSVIFVLFSVLMGTADIRYSEEVIFAGSMVIVVFLMTRLTRTLEPDARKVLVGTSIMIFAFRATPGPGAGSSWWMIDALGFDQQFLSVLSLIGSSLTLAGMFIFRRFMAEKSMAAIIVYLTLIGGILSLPIIGLYYGLSVWTAAHTGGIVDARFIALVDTALESPWGQISMIPMLAWIANSAPRHLKATFFAVMAAFTNLALSLGQLGTKYLNILFTITREVKNAEGTVVVPADYSQLGHLLITVTAVGLLLPLSVILILKFTRLKAVGDPTANPAGNNQNDKNS